MSAQLHILVADDESDIRELVRVMLRAAGFRVSTAKDGAEVLKLVTTERFDALLLDYWMPEATGLELCKQIRSHDQRTPILICSGEISPANREAAALAGAQGYVGKPFVSGDLIRALRTVINKSESEIRNEPKVRSSSAQCEREYVKQTKGTFL